MLALTTRWIVPNHSVVGSATREVGVGGGFGLEARPQVGGCEATPGLLEVQGCNPNHRRGRKRRAGRALGSVRKRTRGVTAEA